MSFTHSSHWWQIHRFYPTFRIEYLAICPYSSEYKLVSPQGTHMEEVIVGNVLLNVMDSQ